MRRVDFVSCGQPTSRMAPHAYPILLESGRIGQGCDPSPAAGGSRRRLVEPFPMAPRRRRRTLLAAVALLGAAGYAVAPLATAAPPRPAMVLGHVPTDPTPLTGAVVVGPGGAVTGYDTKVVVISQGMPLTFVNLDELAHTVTSVARDANGLALF